MAEKAQPRERLDQLLVARGLIESRAKAQALVLAGRVTSEGRRLDKPGVRYRADIPLELRPGRRWVGRGGHKLHAALAEFDCSVAGRDALDVGASTGGFTQVLLEAEARRVIALDVGRGQLNWGLRNDPRVFPVEGVNARYLEPRVLPFAPALATVDVSFISLELVLPQVVACLEAGCDLIALIKPQFEVGRGSVGRGGIVREPALHRAVLERVIGIAGQRDWSVAGLCPSPITGADGNREFLIHIRPEGGGLEPRRLALRIDEVLEVDGG